MKAVLYCVEDDSGIRELVVYTLNNMGFEAAGFSDAQELYTALSEKLPELTEPLAASNGPGDELFPLLEVICDLPLLEEDAPGRLDELDEIGRPFSPEGGDGLLHLERIPDGPSEGLFHPRDDGSYVLPEAAPDRDHQSREGPGRGDVLHEGALPVLDVEEDGIGPRGELLRHDRARDEGNRLDGRGDVAEGVKLLVGRVDLGGLPGNGDADGGDLLPDGFLGKIDVRPGDGLHLVEGSPGVAKPPPAHLGDLAAEARDEGHEGKGGLVADPAGRVLVELDPWDIAQVDEVPAIHHRLG